MTDDPGDPANPAAMFCAMMWDFFIEGASIDGIDLEEALVLSGLAERRPATAKDLEHTKLDGLEVGDDLTCLTAPGAAIMRAGRAPRTPPATERTAQDHSDMTIPPIGTKLISTETQVGKYARADMRDHDALLHAGQQATVVSVEPTHDDVAITLEWDLHDGSKGRLVIGSLTFRLDWYVA